MANADISCSFDHQQDARRNQQTDNFLEVASAANKTNNCAGYGALGSDRNGKLRKVAIRNALKVKLDQWAEIK
ncbi:hypothetical protein ACH5RR_017882 [Cinchona calisaya]|uniref:Uncharacterized protein n=1 Tax=Cinchona calisaya TaxID=153742 RepID=A0ABD2ZK79_9GENT